MRKASSLWWPSAYACSTSSSIPGPSSPYVSRESSGLDLTTTQIAQKLTDVVRTWVTDASAAELMAAIRATEVTMGVTLDELHYYLTIVEQAVSRAQANAAQPGGMVAF